MKKVYLFGLIFSVVNFTLALIQFNWHSFIGWLIVFMFYFSDLLKK